jgi:hypothetical protein
MRANAGITDKVRSVLLRKGLIVWGADSQVTVSHIATTLQSLRDDGVIIFRQVPDTSYMLMHNTISYGSVQVDLEGFNDALLGSRNNKFVERDAIRVQRKLNSLGVNKPIKLK